MDISDYILKGDLRFLKDGVVGSWKSRPVTNMIPSEMEAWAKKAWRLKGNMFFHPLNQNLFFMGFDSTEEADWVMENGSRICRGEALILERWTLSTGCTGSKSQNQEAWIRVVGLPLHLWTEEILVTIGDSCEGFVAMDKETSLMKNLLWARILVKMKSSGRPTSVNLLAGARSYEIQLWWEIQPRVTEVYPRRFSRETEMVNPRVEDEGRIRATGRVNAERGAKRHIPRVAQRDMGQWQALYESGTEGILCQKLKLGGITREGAIPQCEIQKIAGERRREEGTNSPRDVLGCIQGFHHGDEVGQSPGRIHSVVVGQSPRQKMQVVRPINTSRLEKQKTDHAGRLREIDRGSANPNLAKPQNSDASGVEEKDGQKMRPTQNQGRGKENTSKGDVCRKGRMPTRDVRGDQIDKKVSSHHDLDRGLKYGKATRNALISVDSKSGGEEGDSFGGEEGDSVGGEKSWNSFSLPVGGYGRFNFETGREIKARRTPNSREGISSASKSEEEGDDISQEEGTVHPGVECLGKVDGTWPMVLSKERRIYPAQQEKEIIRSGQVRSTDRGSASGEGSVLEMGRVQDWELDSGRPNRTSLGPNPNIGSSLINVGYCGPNCSEAVQRGAGLTQEMQLRSPLQQIHKCSSSDGMEGNVRHRWEDGENREEHSQENDCLNTHRYDDNLYEQSLSALISVFGRPLLLGDISGLGGFNGEEDLEPLKVVAADGRECGVKFSGALIEEGEGLAVADRKSNEVQNESSELWTYESWEKSCLAKFSDFLGFPTKGFEKEITKLLRNLVNAQKLGKGKECQILSKSERELRKPTWTINYKGKEISRVDGRDKGKLLLKLK